jgi:DNA-binding NarL/FixJ family response regulator
VIRVFVADDHHLIREGLRRVLEMSPDMEVVGEARSGEELQSSLPHIAFDILILDISFPDKNGVELLQELPERMRSRTLMLTVYPEEHYGKRALRCGAGGYLNKECEPGELCAAIRKLYHGGRFISEELAEELAEELLAGVNGMPHELLSDREFEILLLFGVGRSAGQIAESLDLSVNTVNSYRRRILEKMHLHSTTELIRYAMRNRLVE